MAKPELSTTSPASTEHSPADAARVAAWLRAETGIEVDPGTATLERLGGGNSNVTLLLTDGTGRWVVRRPPLHALDPSAHSMSREWRVLSAVHGTGVPAVHALAYCQDAELLGTEFLVLELVPDAVSLLDRLPPAYPSGAAALEPLGFALVDALGVLQGFDWVGAGLTGFGRPDGFLKRQVPRWEAQYRRNQVRDLPAFDRVTQWLGEHLPPDQTPGILHGDYHLDNCLFAADRPELLAVVDWEMATVGDPLVDLGLCTALWGARPVDPPAMPAIQAVSRAAGSPSRDDLVVRYAARTGRDVRHMAWYQAFAVWKLAVVVEAAWGQHVRGELRTPYTAALERDVPLMFDEAAWFAGIAGPAGPAGAEETRRTP
jgi:aminoglycoside phosphotransferase (APT) family kinase protein